MTERTFVGAPPGAYDRLVDCSTAIAGSTFFVPTAGMLDALAEPPAEPATATADGGGDDSPPATAASSSPAIGIAPCAAWTGTWPGRRGS